MEVNNFSTLRLKHKMGVYVYYIKPFLTMGGSNGVQAFLFYGTDRWIIWAFHWFSYPLIKKLVSFPFCCNTYCSFF